jgi:hypothetical protein
MAGGVRSSMGSSSARHTAAGERARALEFAAAACADLGVRALHREVERTNTGAQRPYRRLGLENQDRFLMTRRRQR